MSKFKAKTSGFTGATFKPSPNTDLVIPGALNTNNDSDFDIANTSELESFTTKFGTVDNIAGVTSIKNVVTDNTEFGSGENEPPEVDSIRNYWGFEGEEINGGDSLLGLDVSTGLDNAIRVDAFFGTTLDPSGAPGINNDIFIMEQFGDDSIEVFPLDEKGNRIGDFKLEINTGEGNTFLDEQGNFAPQINDSGDWGDTGTDLTAFIDFTSGNIFDDLSLAGVAFDVSDFRGSGKLTDDITGISIQGTTVNSQSGSVDLAAIGYNTSATSSEPTSLIFGSNDGIDISNDGDTAGEGEILGIEDYSDTELISLGTVSTKLESNNNDFFPALIDSNIDSFDNSLLTENQSNIIYPSFVTLRDFL